MRTTIRLALLPAFLATGMLATTWSNASAQPAGSALGAVTGATRGSTGSSTGAPTTPGSAPHVAPGTSGTAITQGAQNEAAGKPGQPLPNGQNNTSGTSRLRSKTDAATTVVPGKRS